MPKLKIVSQGITDFKVLEDTILIGSEEKNDIRLAGVRVAKHHCKIAKDGKIYKLTDLSHYGTHVNGVPVQECQLRSGDTVVVGEATITFVEDSQTAFITQQRKRAVDVEDTDRLLMTTLLKISEPIDLGKGGCPDFHFPALEEIRGWLGALGLAVFLYDASGHRLVAHAGLEAVFNPIRSLVFEPLMPVFKELKATKEILDLSGYKLQLAKTPCENVAKILAVPLMPMKTEVIARFAIEKGPEGLLLLLYDAKKKKFPPGEVTFAEAVAHQLLTRIHNRELFLRASVDPVTQLYNRGFFEQTFKKEMDNAGERHEFLSLVLLDLEIQGRGHDEHGVEGDDEILREAGQLILKHLTVDDVAARYGGSKFIVLLPRQSSIRACHWGNTLRAAFDKYGFPASRIALAMGTATFPDHATSPEELMKHADQALYRAKQQANKQAVYYDEATDAAGPRTDTLAGVISGNAAKDYANIQMLVETVHTMAAYSDFDELLEKLLDRVMRITHAERAIIFLGDTEQELKAHLGRDKSGSRLATIDKYSNTIPQKVFATGQSQCVVGDTGVSETVASSMSMTEFALRTVMCAPLYNKDQKTFGVLYVDSHIHHKKYDPADLILFETIAKQIALAIENARLYQVAIEEQRMRHELGLASQIQQRLLPQVIPALDGFLIYGTMWPALEVGGDYYDIIATSAKKLYICIGDVSGKGLGAGLIMVMARTTLHSLLTTNPKLGCHELLFQINNMIFHNTRRGIFMSMLLLEVNLANQAVSFSGAGHEHILLYRTKDKKCERIPAGGLILGVKKDYAYTKQDLPLSQGDRILLYTDGATEAMNGTSQEFGLDALVAQVETYQHLSGEDMCHSIFDSLQKFMAGQKQHDDITLVALQKK